MSKITAQHIEEIAQGAESFMAAWSIHHRALCALAEAVYQDNTSRDKFCIELAAIYSTSGDITPPIDP